MNTITTVLPALQEIAEAEGVLQIGIAPVEDARASLFAGWIARGHHASMHYLAKNAETRLDPRIRFPWARSVVVITVAYSAERAPMNDSIASRIARYAQGDDYHDVVGRILERIESKLEEIAPDVQTRRYVDTGPLSDRTYAAAAGLGWIGKNGMLIHERHGSYTFIGTLLTSIEIDEVAKPVTDRCGSCTRCIDACPTAAILPDRTVDSNRCISYLTIEHRGVMPEEMSSKLAGNLFGCDICQEVCPWNRDPAEAHPAFTPRESYRAKPVTDLLRMNQESFSTLFRKSAVKRAKRGGMIRNALLIGAVPDAALQSEEDPGIVAALKREPA